MITLPVLHISLDFLRFICYVEARRNEGCPSLFAFFYSGEPKHNGLAFDTKGVIVCPSRTLRITTKMEAIHTTGKPPAPRIIIPSRDGTRPTKNSNTRNSATNVKQNNQPHRYYEQVRCCIIIFLSICLFVDISCIATIEYCCH
jgi:hypothetical protein